MFLLLLLVACPADRLGVELPEGGSKAISAEDLQRDTFALSRPDADAGEVFAGRLSQMHLPASLQGEGRVCARSRGEGTPRVIVAAWPAPGPGLASQAGQGAVLISLAKGWDGQPPPPRPTWLCLAKEGAELPEGERVTVPIAIDAAAIEAIDYRGLRKDTQALLKALGRP